MLAAAPCLDRNEREKGNAMILPRSLATVCLLLATAAFSEELKPFRPADPSARSVSLAGQWRFHLDRETKKGKGEAKNGWEAADFDDSAWARIIVGKPWEAQGYNYNGIAWYRTRVFIPREWERDTLVLRAGMPDDAAETYLNGVSLGKTAKFTEQICYVLKPEQVRFGAVNTISIRVWDWYKGGGLSSGTFAVERVIPFARESVSTKQSPRQPLALSVTRELKDEVMSDPRWQHGMRDEGQADTRMKLSAGRGVFSGKDAVVLDVWYPNSSREFVDYRLGEDENGRAWAGAEYIAFWYRSDETEGEMFLHLNRGDWRWRRRGPSWGARFFVKKGGWHQVVLPLDSFRMKGEPLIDTTRITTLSLGYYNHELQRPGKILFSGFEVGLFNLAPEGRPICLEGPWRFKLDNQREDGTPLDRKNPEEKEGRGLKNRWFAAELDDSDWAVIPVGLNWERYAYHYNGVAWYRQKVLIPKDWTGLPLQFNLGKPDDRGEVYLNGKEVARVEKFGPNFSFLVPPDLVRYGQVNTIAVRIVDWYMGGGLTSGPFSAGPKSFELALRCRNGSPGQFVSPESFEMGPRPGKLVDVALRFYKGIAGDADLEAEYRLLDCFHRTIKAGVVEVKPGAGASLVGLVSLNEEESRQLYYGEWFQFRGTLRSKARGLIAAFERHNVKLRYAERDQLALPPLPETHEETPYGRLKLVDLIDCGKDPAQDEHPYKEGGIRESWVGRRAYAAWEKGVTVQEHKGRKYREANNNEHFGYRVGRKLKPHTAYLLRVLYPDHKSRYQVMHIKAGRNYQGTGFRSGVSPDDPELHYPLSGEYVWYGHLVMNDDVTYGHEGARKVSSENGFWVLFHDNGRCYSPQYQAGPAASEIRLYEIEDVEKHRPRIRYPEGLKRRVLMMDWERKPEAPPYDVGRYARFLGLTAVAPVIQKWASAAYYDSQMGWSVPAADAWNTVVRPGEDNAAVYGKWLDGTRKAGVGLLPRLEYGGSPKLPKEARAIGPSGKPDRAGRYASWGANLLHPATTADINTLLEETIGSRLKANPHLGGILWRMRNDRMVISYGKQDVELFCRETKTSLPKADARRLAKWASSGEIGKNYRRWWHQKRLDFHKKVRDRLRSYRPDLKLYYYNWDPDGWNLGPSLGAGNGPQDWTDYYDRNRSHLFYARKVEARKKLSDQDYVKMLSGFGKPHQVPLMDLYRDVDGIAFFAPVHWRYLADNAPYINYFQTGDGLAICNMFNYEEKGRWNVQNDNYQSSEMTPGGPAFGMAEEVLAMFHGDPNVITWTTYTYGRGFVDTHRRFAQAFLALPDMRGKTVEDALSKPNRDVRVRRYDTKNGIYVSVVHRGMQPATLNIRSPAGGKGSVTDLVAGKRIAATTTDGLISFTVESGAMQLNSFLVE